MRMLLFAGVAFVALSLEVRPVQALEGPWCAVLNYGNGSAYEDCQYFSFEACRPNVLAGNRGFCNPNPRWVAYGPDTKPRARHRRHVQHD